MPAMNEKVRLLTAVAAIAVGSGVLFTSMVGWHYESKINGMERRHAAAMSQLIRSHKKDLLDDKNILAELADIGKDMEHMKLICKGKQ